MWRIRPRPSRRRRARARRLARRRQLQLRMFRYNQVRPISPPPFSSSSSSSSSSLGSIPRPCSAESSTSQPESSSSGSEGRRSVSPSTSTSSTATIRPATAFHFVEAEGTLTLDSFQSKSKHDFDVLESDYWEFLRSRPNTVVEVFTASEQRKDDKKTTPVPSSASAPVLGSTGQNHGSVVRSVSEGAQLGSSKSKGVNFLPVPSSTVVLKKGTAGSATSSSMEVLHAVRTDRLIVPDSSSIMSGSTVPGKSRHRQLNTAELFAKQVEKERRRAAGLEVTSSTSSTVDENDVRADIRMRRRIKWLGCCHCLGRIGRKIRHRFCRAFQYIFMKYKWCYRRNVTQEEVHDMHMMWKYVGRTSNSASYVASLYRYASMANLPKGRIETFKARKVGLRNVHVTIRHMDRAIQLCQQVNDALGFSEIYMLTKPSTELNRMLDGRSIIGNYAWLFTYAIDVLDIPKAEAREAYSGLHKQFEGLFSSSIHCWSAVCHVYGTIMSILKKMEAIVVRWVLNVRAYTNTGGAFDIEHVKYKDEVIHRETWKKVKARNDMRIRYHKTHFKSWLDIPDPPELNIITRIQGMDKHWHDFDALHWREQTKTISHLMKRAKTLGDDIFELLVALDNEIFIPRNKRKRRRKEPKCIYQGIKYLRQNFKQFHEFPTNMVKASEVLEFNEIGRILLDKIDALFLEANKMKDVGREARHMIQLSYEVLRTKHGWPIPEYTDRANKLHRRFMLRWAHHEFFRAREWAMDMVNPEALFNSSVYQVFVKWVPCRVGRILFSVETPEEVKKNRAKTAPDMDRPDAPVVRLTLDQALKVPLKLDVATAEKIFPRRF